jgi:Protein of unknown function (DUF3631)
VAENDIDRVTEIERLAALDLIDYEVARAEAAERLSVRASALDRAVVKKRKELGLGDEIDDGQGRAVKIIDPLSWPESVDGDMIASICAAALKTYAVLPDAAADVITLWVLHSWLVPQLIISPRLAITSPTKGCGKTTVLRLLGQLARRPKRAGSISPSALFRVVEKFQPTLILDETEKYIEHGSDLHALINEGHCKGGTVLRVLGEKNDLREFRVFAAIAFARNGRLPDDLEQRSIVIEMQRRRPDESLAELREDRCQSLQDITRMCSRWSEDHATEVAETDPDMGTLINRDADNWRPLFAIADVIGSDWPERIREAAALLRPRDIESTGPMLLGDIQATFDDRQTDRLASTELVEALAAIEGRPWAEWRAGKGASPKPISPNQLARLLRPFQIMTNTTIRIGSKTVKGYRRDQFEQAWQRYLTPCDRSQSNNADEIRVSNTSQSVTPDSDVTDQKCEKPNNDAPCYHVTDRKPSNGHGEDNAGLSPRAIEQLAHDVEEWVYGRRYDGDTSEDQIEAEIRRRLTDNGIFPEAIEAEVERVLKHLYEPRQVAPPFSSSQLKN